MKGRSYNGEVHQTERSVLVDFSRQIREEILRTYLQHGIAHLGSCLSVVEILCTLVKRHLRNFTPEDFSPSGDLLILSKGHAAVALYSILKNLGFVSQEDLDTFSHPGSIFEEHPNFKIPTVQTATGSLGHGLPFGNGLALGRKTKGSDGHVFVVMSDGECNEGTVWESCAFAAANKLNNITVLVDNNGWQATGRIDETMPGVALGKVFESFGWFSRTIDGHDLPQLDDALQAARIAAKPTAIICKTIKGRGVSFMEDDNNWHYRAPSQDEFERAMKELASRHA